MSGSLDPKEEAAKQAQEKGKLESPKEPERPDLSLGGIVPLGSDAMKTHAAPGASRIEEATLDFGTTGEPTQNRIPAELNRYLGQGRGLTSELGRELTRDAHGSIRNPGDSTREFRWAGGESMAGGLSFPLGNRQFFRAQKSEFKLGNDAKQLENLKPDLEKFLATTGETDESKLTPAEKQELNNTRRNIAEAANPGELLSNTLHLARLYQHLRYIEEAKKAVEFSLGLDPDNMLGKQLFKELERMHPVDMSATALAISSADLTKSALRQRIINFSQGRIIVLGDLLIDELLEGKPERISREAPVLILEHVDTVLIPGGAANTAHNIAALGGKCHAIGVCGRDHYAVKLANLLTSCGITHALVEDESRPTTVKTRILSKSHSLMQQLLRLDRISHDLITKSVEDELMKRLNECAGSYKALVLSDYKSGVITDGIIAACRNVASRHNLLVIVDAQQNFARFKSVTLMTPNQPDTESAVGYALDSKEALQRAGNEILAQTGAKALLITRGGEGMVLFQHNAEMVELPAFNRSDVFDVTGAGDTVVGTMSLALVTGATFVEAMALGNLAAGIVVRKSGTAVTSQKELLDNLEMLNLAD